MWGPNGAGKTTLFRMIIGQEHPYEGQVSTDRGITIGYFSQDVGEMSGKSAVSEVMDGAGPVSARRGGTGGTGGRDGHPDRADEMEEIVERYGEVQGRFEELGGYALEGRARESARRFLLEPGNDGRRCRRIVGRLEDARWPAPSQIIDTATPMAQTVMIMMNKRGVSPILRPWISSPIVGRMEM